MAQALILVDIQNDFLPGGALAVAHGDEVVAVANRLIGHFDHVLATQDWHPPGHLSFAANHDLRRIGEVIELNGLPQLLWPAHCVQNSGGALFAPGLETRKIRRVFPKGIEEGFDSYSGFFDNGHHRATGLGDYLKAEGVGRVHIVGLATDYCVKFTALDALASGFETVLVADACRGVDLAAGDSEKALAELQAAGASIVTSEALVAATLPATTRGVRQN